MQKDVIKTWIFLVEKIKKRGGGFPNQIDPKDTYDKFWWVLMSCESYMKCREY